MLDDNKDKLLTSGEAATALDLRRDYHYGRGIPVEEDKVHLRDYWRIVRRRLWVPLSMVFIIGTLTTIYMLRSPNIYESRTTIQIDRERSAVDYKELTFLGDDSQYINTQIQILKLRDTAYGVAKALDLANNKKFINRDATPENQEALKLQITAGETDEGLEKIKLDQEIATLLKNVDVVRRRETRLVDIAYRHPDDKLARLITDTWADVYMKDHLKRRREGNKNSADELDRYISTIKLQLKEAQEQLFNFRATRGIVDFGEKEGSKDNPVLARLLDLNKQFLQVESERKVLEISVGSSQQEQEKKEKGSLSQLPEIQRDPIVQDLTKKLADLKEKKARLLVDLKEDYPDVTQVSAQIESTEGELRASYQRILSGIETQYKIAKLREDGLRQDFITQLGTTRKQDEDTIRAKILQQEADTNQALLVKLQQSQKEMTVSSISQSNNVRIINYSPPPEQVGPQRGRNIALGILMSLIGGLGLVLFIDYLNNKVESVEDIDRYLHLPALGVIPIFPLGKARKRLAGVAASKDLTTAQVKGNGAGGAMILTEVESTSSIAESYRQLRTAVLLSSAEHAPRTILFTSSQPAEGKTTTSVNMAISLAQTGSSVLIVDADLRRPRVHKIFGLKNTRGLCNYLAGDCDFSSLIQVALPNLYVLPVGPLPPNPAELLGSPKMRQVVEMLSKNFDYVLIDSPPVASFADSLILSSMVEGVIIVVKSGFTAREMAQRTKLHLQSVGAKILGVVINHIKLQPHDYYYYSTYYSRYYYQSGEGDEARTEREAQATAKNA